MVKQLNIIWKLHASYDKIKDSREMKNKAFMDGCKTLIVLPDKILIFQDLLCVFPKSSNIFYMNVDFTLSRQHIFDVVSLTKAFVSASLSVICLSY